MVLNGKENIDVLKLFAKDLPSPQSCDNCVYYNLKADKHCIFDNDCPYNIKEANNDNGTLCCEECGDEIYSGDTYYDIDDTIICKDCMNRYKKVR